MTRRAAGLRAVTVAGAETVDLGSLIDWEALRGRGWHPETEVFAPDADDAVFGFAVCSAANCDQKAVPPGLALCRRCQTRWERSPSMAFEEFCQHAPARTKAVGGGLCLVCRTVGHERPVRGNGLCTACMAAARDRGQSVTAYVAGDAFFPPAQPRPTFGPCGALACQRLAHRARPALCETHERVWNGDGRPDGAEFETWCARARALDVGSHVVVLAGLPPTAQLEVLYGLHVAAGLERRTQVKALQGAVRGLRASGATRVADVTVEGLPRDARLFLAFIRDRVRLASTSPQEEVTN